MDITTVYHGLVFEYQNLKGLVDPKTEDVAPQIKSEFTIEAERLTDQLNAIQSFVEEMASSYLRIHHQVGPSSTGNKSDIMTEVERDEMEHEVASLAKEFFRQTDELHQLLPSFRTKNGHDHGIAVIECLVSRLKKVVKKFESMQKQRIKQGKIKSSLIPETAALPTIKPPLRESTPIFNDVQLEEEEVETFRLENSMLEAQLHDDLDEAQQMERKITEISSLIDTFTSNVSKQHEDIDNIHDYAKESTANIDQGNEQLEKAREYGSTFGIFMFCFLVGISILLLMLHYFND